jgi:predicted Zn finger-like uncharacterized protein
MIVTCPGCGARFRVDPARLGPEGRRVRCSACGHRWLVRPEAEASGGATRAAPSAEPTRAETAGAAPLSLVTGEPAPAGGPADRPPPLAAAPALGQPPSGRGTAIAGWLVVVLILLVLAGLVVGRNEVVAAFPRALALYDRLGLPVTARHGLELKNLQARRLEEHGVTIFVVEGEVHNLTRSERPIPPVRVALLDGEGRELDSALFRAAQPTVAGGGVARFEAKMVDPPPVARSFRVAFEPGS